MITIDQYLCFAPYLSFLKKLSIISCTTISRKNKLFHDNQYGFRTKRSTELAVTELIDRVLLNIDNKQVPFAVFMDLSKAFDTLDHKILIDKLHHYGIGGISLMWFESYLSKRTQYVEIDNFKSSPQTITTGVPQGSILGPLLFLIYMNDMPQARSIFKCILYADDTTPLQCIRLLAAIGHSGIQRTY